MGGSNDINNIIELTVEEHAKAHKELFEKYGNWQDKIAWKALSGQIDKQDIIREVQRLTHLGKKRSKEWCDNIGKSKKGVKQKQETIEKRRIKLIGQTRQFTDEWKKNISTGKKGQTPWIKGKKHSEESKEKNRISHVGNTYNRGRKHSQESRKNMSEAHKGQIPYNKGLKYEIVKCTYCSKEGGSNSMKRYHFENCKDKKN
jgi:hypothetical protein